MNNNNKVVTKKHHIKQKVLSSFFWKLMERVGASGIQFIVTIFLARLLLPTDFGLIAIANVLIAILDVFVQSGFNVALIQKKDADELDWSTAFYFNLFLAFILYVLLFIAAPFIGSFYGEPLLGSVIQVLSTVLIINSISAKLQAMVRKNMEFKKLFYRTFGAVLPSGIIGISMAYLGYGVWALVATTISNAIFTTVILMISMRWYPKWMFSFERLKFIYSFGWKMLITGLLNSLFLNIRMLIIGKMFSPAVLGYYKKGEEFSGFARSNVSSVIEAVMFPAYALMQDDRNKLKQMLRRTISLNLFVLCPMLVGIATVGKSLVIVILTEKWLPCVPFLQILCFASIFIPMVTSEIQVLTAIGRSDMVMKLNLMKKGIAMGILLISMFYDAYVIAFGMIVSSVVDIIVHLKPNSELFQYTAREQMQDILPPLGISLIMGTFVYLVGFIPINMYLLLALQVVSGVGFYVLLAHLLKIEPYGYLLRHIKEYLGRKKPVN